MQKRLLIFIFLIFNSAIAFAQKDIAIVPLAEVVQDDKVYNQVGLTINDDLSQLSNNFTIGFNGNIQGGITVIDATFNYGPDGNFFPVENYQPEVNPDILINLHKGIKISKKIWFGIGTQSGVNVAREKTGFSTFNYLNGQVSLFGDNKVVFGGYHGNDARLDTDENRLGWMAGLDISITEKVSLAGDVISGNHARSLINSGISIDVLNNWTIFGGAILPYPDSGNKYGAFIQVTYLSN